MCEAGGLSAKLGANVRCSSRHWSFLPLGRTRFVPAETRRTRAWPQGGFGERKGDRVVSNAFGSPFVPCASTYCNCFESRSSFSVRSVGGVVEALFPGDLFKGVVHHQLPQRVCMTPLRHACAAFPFTWCTADSCGGQSLSWERRIPSQFPILHWVSQNEVGMQWLWETQRISKDYENCNVWTRLARIQAIQRTQWPWWSRPFSSPFGCFVECPGCSILHRQSFSHRWGAKKRKGLVLDGAGVPLNLFCEGRRSISAVALVSEV